MPAFSPMLAPTSCTSTKTLSVQGQDTEPCAVHWPTILYLFTASDFKTMVFPVTCFAIVAGPVSSWMSFVGAVAWIWIHLLQFNVSNQCGGVDEDILNKPWRPIPAGLISLPAARQLRWNASILSLGFSFVFGSTITWISISIAAATWIYNEAHLSSHWFGKSAFSAIGYVMFQAGATVIMSGEDHLDTVALYSLMWSAIVILTTVHVQDFGDVEGDAAMGRKTLPIILPVGSRLLTITTITAYSWYVTAFWATGPAVRMLFVLYGFAIAFRYAYYRDCRQDKQTYVMYNIWLMALVLLPVQARWSLLAM